MWVTVTRFIATITSMINQINTCKIDCDAGLPTTQSITYLCFVNCLVIDVIVAINLNLILLDLGPYFCNVVC